MMERDNRKSHLAPQLSPSTQELLRSGDSPIFPPQHEDRSLQTPTSGEIPIASTGFMSPADSMTHGNRSPTRNGSGRTPITPHPGLGSRSNTATSIPKASGYSASSGPAPNSANGTTFSLPVRPAPPGGPLPPPPPRKETPDESRRAEHRKQTTFGNDR